MLLCTLYKITCTSSRHTTHISVIVIQLTIYQILQTQTSTRRRGTLSKLGKLWHAWRYKAGGILKLGYNCELLWFGYIITLLQYWILAQVIIIILSYWKFYMDQTRSQARYLLTDTNLTSKFWEYTLKYTCPSLRVDWNRTKFVIRATIGPP